MTWIIEAGLTLIELAGIGLVFWLCVCGWVGFGIVRDYEGRSND